MQCKLSSICISFLTQLLDLNSLEELLDKDRESYVLQNIKSELANESVHEAISNLDMSEKKEKKSTHKKLLKSNSKESLYVFGGKLTEHSVKIIIQIMDHLKNYTDVEGLFRISGNKRRQEDLKELLNKGQLIDLTEKTHSQHDLATILKQYFAQLSEPLLTNSLYNSYKQVAGKTQEMDGSTSSKKRLKSLQLLSLLLPPLNRQLLKKLIELLHLVSEKTINLMTSKNLAVVFAPNIAVKTKMSCLNDYNENLEPLTEIMEFMIENAAKIFKVPNEIFDLKKKSTGDDILKTPKVYCQQYDPKNYQQETIKNTNEALAELYSQVVAMPENHPMRKQFLDDFKKKYPGTPPFIPQSRRLQRMAESPSANTTPLKRKCSMEQFSKDREEKLRTEDAIFLSTPEKKKLFTEGDLACHMTPEIADSNTGEPEYELIKEKRKKFRRPSFGRPSFGFLSKRSTPDLRKIKISFGSTSKRARSSSSTDLPDGEPKRRFSLTPFTERRSNPQRPLTERKPSRKYNKVKSYDNEVKSSPDNLKMNADVKQQENQDAINNRCANKQIVFDAKQSSERPPKQRPELRAPLMSLKVPGKPLLPGYPNARRETIAVNKENIVSSVDAYRPRRETLSVHRDQSTAVPFRPRRENIVFGKGEPVLESFKPKRDSLLIHKKIQPRNDVIKCVKKQIYSDCENVKSEELGSQKYNSACSFRRAADWSIEFKSFGKKPEDFAVKDNSPIAFNSMHNRRMSTGSIARMRPIEDGCMVTFL